MYGSHQQYSYLFLQLCNTITGILGGFGYTALIALCTTTIKKAIPKVTWALSSVGKRSLTFLI